MTSCLYRHFDKDGALLYVGVSLSAVHRLSQHRVGSHWFVEIAAIKIETFQDRKAALAAEREAITKENPRYNLKRPTVKEVRAAEAALVEESRTDLVRRLVQYNPLYSMQGVADALDLSVGRVKHLMENGELGYVEIGDRKWVTGWQLIEFLESATAARAHTLAHTSIADTGGKRRTMAEGSGAFNA